MSSITRFLIWIAMVRIEAEWSKLVSVDESVTG